MLVSMSSCLKNKFSMQMHYDLPPGLMLGAASGGSLFQLDPRLPFVATGCVCLVAFLALSVLYGIKNNKTVGRGTRPVAPLPEDEQKTVPAHHTIVPRIGTDTAGTRTSPAETPAVSLWALLQKPTIRALLVAYLLAMTMEGFEHASLGRYCMGTFGMDESQVGGLLILFFCFTVLSTTFAGLLIARVGPFAAVSCGVLIMGAAILTGVGLRSRLVFLQASLVGMGMGLGIQESAVILGLGMETDRLFPDAAAVSAGGKQEGPSPRGLGDESAKEPAQSKPNTEGVYVLFSVIVEVRVSFLWKTYKVLGHSPGTQSLDTVLGHSPRTQSF